MTTIEVQEVTITRLCFVLGQDMVRPSVAGEGRNDETGPKGCRLSGRVEKARDS